MKKPKKPFVRCERSMENLVAVTSANAALWAAMKNTAAQQSARISQGGSRFNQHHAPEPGRDFPGTYTGNKGPIDVE
jgi:hypothetical protein